MAVYEGLTNLNHKQVSVKFNPGWGEPGEWYLYYNEPGKDVDTIARPYYPTQLEELKAMLNHTDPAAGIKYAIELFTTNWSGFGDNEQVVLRVLQYVEYDNANELDDENNLTKVKTRIDKILRQFTKTVSKAYNQEETTKALRQLEMDLKVLFDEKNRIDSRLQVYKKMKSGESVIQWSNESFWRDFGTTPEASEMKKLLEEVSSN